MVVADQTQFLLVTAALFLVSVVSSDDVSAGSVDNQNLQTRMFFQGLSRVIVPMNSFPFSGTTQPHSAEKILKEALDRNVCADFNPAVPLPFLNPVNVREQRRCSSTAQLLFASNIERPEDCRVLLGARCAWDGNRKTVCMVRTRPGIFAQGEKPLSYCAQKFRPTSQPEQGNSSNRPKPQPLQPTNSANNSGKNPGNQPARPIDDPSKSPSDNQIPPKPVDDSNKNPDIPTPLKPVDDLNKDSNAQTPPNPVDNSNKASDTQIPSKPADTNNQKPTI